MADVKLNNEVSEVLKRSQITGNVLILPPGQLERSLYEAVNKALTAAGGKWSKSAKGHVFQGDPREKLKSMLCSGVAVDEKKKFQAFFTPPELAQRVAEFACIDGERVLEPSAGHGALAHACLASGASAVDCVELNPEYADKLKRDRCFTVTQGDFLKIDIGMYQRIVMNPPFTKSQDIKHVSHALKFLAAGGILVAIMSPNVSRPQFKALVDGLKHEVDEVEDGAFKESGTSIKTIILKVRQ